VIEPPETEMPLDLVGKILAIVLSREPENVSVVVLTSKLQSLRYLGS
jgi:hypothetical protein